MGPAAGLPPDVLSMVRSMLPVSGGRNYEFTSENGFWKLTLTKDAIALECGAGQYTAWEQYREKLLGPLDALRQEYAPSFFNRVGLRYVNFIRRSTLNLRDVGWAELLNPQIAAELASSMAADVLESNHRVLIRLNEQGDKVRIRYGFAIAKNPQEVCYLIDNDFFSEQRTEGNNAAARLEELHRESGNCFRWCIAEPLHRAMGPQLVDGAQRRA